MNLVLDYHKYNDLLKIKKEGGQTYIWCTIRRKYLVLKPEELVRQLTIQYLIHEVKYPEKRIHVEKSITINGISRRFDVIVYDQGIHPFLLVECKSHKVKISQSTLDQVSRYNIAVGAPYLFVTNGISNFCVALDLHEKTYAFMDDLPEMT